MFAKRFRGNIDGIRQPNLLGRCQLICQGPNHVVDDLQYAPVLLGSRHGMDLWHSIFFQRGADLPQKPRKLVQAFRGIVQPIFGRREISCHQIVDRVTSEAAVDQRIPCPLLKFRLFLDL